MSDGGQGQSQAIYRKPRSTVRELKITVTISEGDVRDLLASLQRPIVEAVATTLTKIKESASANPPAPPPPAEKAALEKAAVEKTVGGIRLSDAERLKAADLRTGLLLGKVPDTAGLLIDKKVMARLLNVSLRTLHQLHVTEAIPEAVRLGGSIVRWKLAEILDWMDAGCPTRSKWTYSGGSETTKRRK